MKPTTRIALAGLLSAAGSALHAFASEMCDGIPAADPAPAGLGASVPPGTITSPSADIPNIPVEAPTRKPRKTAAEKPVAATEPEPQPEPIPAPAEPEPAPEAEGETQEQKDARYAKNRALIEPLVKGVKVDGSETEYKIKPQGGAVKAIIKKYSPTEKLPDLPLDKQADFEGDIEALTM